MVARSAAKQILNSFSDEQSERDGAQKTRQQTGRAFQLELRPKCGSPEFFAWQLYQGGKLFDQANPECLILFFHHRVAVITGYHLQQIVGFIELERCELVAEHDEPRVIEIQAENEALANPELRKAIILSVKGEPDFMDMYEQLRTTRREDDDYEARNH